MIPFTAREFSTVDTYKGLSGLFAEGFVLDATRNKNKWRATEESIKKCYADFMGRPGIEYMKCTGSVCDRDHTNGATYKQNMAAQEMFRETNIIDLKLDESTMTLSAVEHILNPEFEKMIQTKAVKYRSPSLWPLKWKIVGNEDGIDLIDVLEWWALHIAYVDKPAFGDNAKIYSSCKDHGSKCKVHFHASQTSLGASLGLPVIVRHNKQLHIAKIDDRINKVIETRLAKGLPITEHIFSGTHKIGALTASCTPCQNKKLNYKVAKLKNKLDSSQ